MVARSRLARQISERPVELATRDRRGYNRPRQTRIRHGRRPMLLISADDLRATATEIFRAAGAEPEPTRILVEHLIDANLAGHDSHGVLRIPSYVNLIQSGRIQPNNRPVVVRETTVSAIVDGNQTFGQVSARFGTDVAVAKAKLSGVGVVGIVRCNHIGRL